MNQCKDCVWYVKTKIPFDEIAAFECSNEMLIENYMSGFEFDGFFPPENFGCALWEGKNGEERDSSNQQPIVA